MLELFELIEFELSFSLLKDFWSDLFVRLLYGVRLPGPDILRVVVYSALRVHCGSLRSELVRELNAPTWLILPAVICLGRRLSHASLRTASNCESANGSLQQT